MAPDAAPADHELEDHEVEDHDRGLSHDLPTLLNRRRALSIFGGAGLAAALAACGAGSTGSPRSGATSHLRGALRIGVGDRRDRATPSPRRPAGPFPGDGSNGVNVLTESGIVRSDIRTSFGGVDGVAAGVPLTVNLKVLDTENGSAGLAGCRGLPLALRHRRQVLALLATASRRRTTCAGCRRPTPTGR